MRWFYSLFVAFGTLALGAFPEPVNTEPGQPMPAAEVARSMQLPKGFRAEVFAAEPEVRQPIAMNWDKRGRLWVAECYTYAENPQRWNREMRDRILVLEDSDGDGRHDKRKVFWEEGMILTSVEVGHGGVWVLNDGALGFLPDRNGDDLPDGPLEVKLDGFNTRSIGHNIVNGLRWGPDGWLYGRHGITETSAVGAPGTPQDQRLKFNCAIWRYHPRDGRLEVVCHGGTNSWGHDWDAGGELFYINTVIGHLWHGVPGSYHRRMFGSHLNPYVYEIIEQTADHFHWDIGAEKWSDIRKGISERTKSLGGGHAHVGMMIYQGGLWPAAYQGRVFACNLHGHRINVDRLEQRGCGFVGKHEPDFMLTGDEWFRGLEILEAPDGNVLVSDWSDSGECHDNDGVHRSSGRIYKIIYEGGAKGHRNAHWQGRMDLLARCEKGDFPAERPISTPALARSDRGLDRLHAASDLQRLPVAQRWELATALASQARDADDAQQPLMIWYGIEPAVAADRQRAVELVKQSAMPKLRRLIVRRLAEDNAAGDAAMAALMPLIGGGEGLAEDVIIGMAAGLQGMSQTPKPTGWDQAVAALKLDGPAAEALTQLQVLFGSGRAMEELEKVVRNEEADAKARVQALQSLSQRPDPKRLPLLLGLLRDKVLALPVRRALGVYEDPAVAKAILNAWPSSAGDLQQASVEALISRPAHAAALIEAMANGRVPRSHVGVLQARAIAQLGDEKLQRRLREVWGELRVNGADRAAEIARWRAQLDAATLARGDAKRGKQVFAGVCAACHRLYGEGGQLGPDLTGSDRRQLNYLLENLLDPNAVVPADYRMEVIQLKDGRTLSGVIAERAQNTLTLQTPAQRQVVARSDIASQQTLPQSMMPEGLLQALGRDAVADLFAYLMSSAPPSNE